MGSTESMVAVESLRDQISELEDKLVSLEAEAVSHEGQAQQRGRQLMCGTATIATNEDVSVVTGPVVGMVSPNNARVLVEVDQDCDVALHLCIVDQVMPSGRHLAVVTHRMSAYRPQAFCFHDLKAGRRYAVYIEGVKRSDMEKRYARFTLPAEDSKKFRVVTVSCNAPQAATAGYGAWKALAQRTVESSGAFADAEEQQSEGCTKARLIKSVPPVHAVLHLGGQVCMTHTFERALQFLRQELGLCSSRAAAVTGSASASVTDVVKDAKSSWRAAEQHVLNMFRDVYRFTWNLPYVREVLAHASNLMLPGERDVHPDFTRLTAPSADDPDAEAAAVAIRLARRVTEEYQGQLWRGPLIAELDREYASLEAAYDKMQSLVRRRQAAEVELLRAELALRNVRAMRDLREPPAAADPATTDSVVEFLESRVAELRTEITQTQQLELGAATAVPELALRGTRTYQSGHVALWAPDVRWGQVLSIGSSAPPHHRNMSREEWEAGQKFVDNLHLDVTTVILALDAPLVDTGDDNRLMSKLWAEAKEEQQDIIQLLLDWRAKEGRHEVVALVGGIAVAMETLIHRRSANPPPPVRRRRKKEIEDRDGRVVDEEYVEEDVVATAEAEEPVMLQLSTGPVADCVGAVTDLPQYGAMLHGEKVVDFVHNMVGGEPCYLEVVVEAGGNLSRAKVARRWAGGPNMIGTKVLLGPVIGQVTCTAAAILLEVDEDAVVTCVLSDAISGRQLRLTRHMPARRPFAFVAEGLDPGRCYQVVFEGVLHGELRMGSFTTPVNSNSSRPDRNYVALVAHADVVSKPATLRLPQDGYGDGGMGLASLRESQAVVSGLVRLPMGAVDVLVVVGGGIVDLAQELGEAATLLYAAEDHPGGSSARQELQERAAERVRAGYRTWWELTENRELLANGALLQIPIPQDSTAALLDTGILSTYVRETLSRIVHQLVLEYESQLWLPSQWSSHSDGWRFHQWGQVGMVFLFTVHSPLDTTSFSSSSSSATTKTCMLTPQQWSALGDVLIKPEIETLIIVSEVGPIVLDSIAVVEKRLRTALTHEEKQRASTQWTARPRDLRKLIKALVEWKGRAAGRQVVVIGAGPGVGLETTVEGPSGQILTQILVGPVTDTSVKPLSSLGIQPTGTLDPSGLGLTFRHRPPKPARTVALLTTRVDSYGRTVLRPQMVQLDQTVITSSGPDTLNMDFAQLLQMRRKRLHELPSVDVGNDAELGKRLADLDAAMRSMHTFKVFADAWESVRLSNVLLSATSPLQVSQALMPQIAKCYHYGLAGAYRHVIPPPSHLVVEKVAKRWMSSIQSIGTEAAQIAAEAAQYQLGGTGAGFGYGAMDGTGQATFAMSGDDDDDLAPGRVYVPIELGDAQVFLQFARECFAAGILLQVRAAGVGDL